MRIRVLGPVQVSTGDAVVEVGPAQRCRVLAALAADAGRLVSRAVLIDRIWGQSPPAGAWRTVQTHIASLRRVLKQAGALETEMRVHRGGGYLLDVDPDTVDVHRFRRLAAEAAQDGSGGAERIALWREAMGLWRGEPLAGLGTDWAERTRDAWYGEYRDAVLGWADAEIGAGDPTAVIGTLVDLVVRYPLVEAVSVVLMRALYAAGRRTDALECYTVARRRLDEELAESPGPELRAVYQAILRREATLVPPLGAAPAATAVLAQHRRGRPSEASAHSQRRQQRCAEELGIDPGPLLQRVDQEILTTDSVLGAPARTPPAACVPVPRQLPAPPRLFTGRSDQLADLTAVLDEHSETGATMPISVIVGTGGIGKTWLALHWAYQHLDRFPDGQLHVDLRGFDPSGSPRAPAMVLRGFLDALGVEPARIPSALDAQIGLYRSLLAGRRMLVVLDNARDTAQVAALLPGSPTCAVLVTSRHRLDGLTTAHGARLLRLGFLVNDDARKLLASRINRDRVNAEPDAVEELLVYCAGLPLALSIAAARAGSEPLFPLAALVEELRDHNARLDAMGTGDTPATLRAVLSWSHHALSPATAAAFGLLGLAPGDDISLFAAASLLGVPLASARLTLRELEHAHLVQQHIPGRYLMHDLVRLYAIDRTGHEHAQESRTEATRRVIDFYVHTAFAADQLLQPLLPPIKIGEPAGGCQQHSFRDQRAALAWFSVEHPNLLAAQDLAAAEGRAASVYQLAWILTTFLYRQGDFHAVLAVWQSGQAAAQQLNDPHAQTGAHQLLGAVFTELGRHTEALRHLTLAQDPGDLHGEAYTHHTLGWFWSLQGDNRRALEHASRALRLCRTLDMLAGEIRQLTLIGWYHARMGEHDKARVAGELALSTARRHQYREDEALAMGILGYIAQHTGQYTAAVDWYQQSHALLHETGSTYFEAAVLDMLGQTYTILGEPAPACRAWKRALQLCQNQHRSADVERIQRQLDALTS